MARISALFFFCILAVTAGAQKFTISNPAQNFFYKGITNPLQIVVSGYPCQSFFLSTDNGIIEGNLCHYYTYVPARAGVAKITLWQRSNHKKKKIGESLFRVRLIPDPRPTIGGSHGGPASKKYLITQAGIIARVDGEVGICANFHIDSFHVIILRKDSVVFSHQSTGPRYDTESISAFNGLQPGDTLFFTNISCVAPDGGRRRLNSLEFTITD